MSFKEIILASILQGVTEFLPISSSGHLVILHSFFGAKKPEVLVDVFLHIGTLWAIIIIYRKKLYDIFKLKDKKLIFNLLIATIPIVIFAFFIANFINIVYLEPRMVGFFLILTACFLLSAHIYTKKTYNSKNPADDKINIWRSVIIGFSQAIALIPGISRSGATISTGILSGVNREEAIHFSFLLAIPATFGALIYKLFEAYQKNISIQVPLTYILTGIFISFLVGFICLKLLIKLIRNFKLYIFGIYCLILAGIVIWRID